MTEKPKLQTVTDDFEDEKPLAQEDPDADEVVRTPKEAAGIAVDAYAALQNDLMRYVRTVAQENRRRFEGSAKSKYGELQLAFTGASMLYTRVKNVVEFADNAKVQFHLRKHMRVVHVAHKNLMAELAKGAILRSTCDDENQAQVMMLVKIVNKVMATVETVDRRLKLNAKDEERRMGRKKARAVKSAWRSVERSAIRQREAQEKVIH